mmetsp:Transcript_59713/g.136961  ORF Transcript_59713/g.136961 Transcript_59713/m.136961 type:complete len:280 (+) Transcript_59713:510-1349(+)
MPSPPGARRTSGEASLVTTKRLARYTASCTCATPATRTKRDAKACRTGPCEPRLRSAPKPPAQRCQRRVALASHSSISASLEAASVSASLDAATASAGQSPPSSRLAPSPAGQLGARRTTLDGTVKRRTLRVTTDTPPHEQPPSGDAIGGATCSSASTPARCACSTRKPYRPPKAGGWNARKTKPERGSSATPAHSELHAPSPALLAVHVSRTMSWRPTLRLVAAASASAARVAAAASRKKARICASLTAPPSLGASLSHHQCGLPGSSANCTLLASPA